LYYALGTAAGDYIGKANGKNKSGVPADIIDGLTDKGTSAEDEQVLEADGIEDTITPT
jgi:hypothetical protein